MSSFSIERSPFLVRSVQERQVTGLRLHDRASERHLGRAKPCIWDAMSEWAYKWKEEFEQSYERG